MEEGTILSSAHVVRLVLPVGIKVPMDEAVRAQEAFVGLLEEVSRSVAGTAEQPVTWVLEEVRKSSADYHMVPLPREAYVTPAMLGSMATAVPDGLRSLATGGDRPRYFTDRALELTATFTRVAGRLPWVRVGAGASVRAVAASAGANAQRLLDQPYVSETGTIEGRMQAVNVYRSRQFVIYDEMTAQRIPCQFASRIPLARVLAGMDRRVSVTGEIRARDHGEITSMIAEDLEVLPDDDELPSSVDIMGILGEG